MMPDLFSYRSAEEVALGLSSHNNHYLFSDHFLNVILKQDKGWKKATEETEPFLKWLTTLYQQEKKQLAQYSESQLEEHWFKPIFRHLGHIFEGQVKIPALFGPQIKYPDYIFFADESGRQQLAQSPHKTEQIKHALAVGEVKKWGVALGKKTEEGQTFAENNPSFQIDYYVRATGLKWGILTNGVLWRLVHRDTSQKLDVYFEINLEKAIQEQSKAACAFFLLFFQQSSFRPGPDTGRSFLDLALQDSRAYALKLEEDLRDNAYLALEQLIQGFLEVQANALTVADLPEIYTNSLYLLYRLIFLFYGESRGLLPIENTLYQEQYSIKQLAQHIATNIDRPLAHHDKFLKNGARIWSHLRELFIIIDGRYSAFNRELKVPIYNGGLFSASQHPFLEQKFVGDYFLSEAIDALARRWVGDKKEEQKREPVDYRTLGVRQIGSIYEGLLEYQPRLASEPLVSVKKGKVEQWFPAATKPKKADIIAHKAPGEIYLTTDKGERKATGSYYTPDYIVEYMVDQTLAPLIDHIRRHLPPAAPHQFAAEVLKLRVLDPAMGSGHFLVEATDYLARTIATDNNSRLANPASPADDDLVNWRRQVAEQCIYGVDKNPMAVELAKVSLWLITVAKKKPLSFLDHHLRHGDSLVGATLSDLVTLPTPTPSTASSDQPPLYLDTHFTQDMFRAVGGMKRIATILSETIEDVHLKNATFQELQTHHLAQWRKIADVWCSHFLGNEMTPPAWAVLQEYLHQQAAGANLPFPELKTLDHHLEHPAVVNHDYFHWELQFPEIFFDEHGQLRPETAGFDVIIGNPPYIRQELLTRYKRFWETKYPAFYAGTADIFVYFFAQALRLLRPHGRTAYISSNSWFRANYATKLRAMLRQHTTIQTLLDLGDNHIFADAPDLYPAIHVVQKSPPTTPHTALAAVFARGENITEFWSQLPQKLFPLRIDNQPDEGWSLEKDMTRDLAFRLLKLGVPLGEFINHQLFYGIKTGFNRAFIVSDEVRQQLIREDVHCTPLLKPLVSGAEVRPWGIRRRGQWLVALPNGWTQQTAVSPFNTEEEAWHWFSTHYPSLAKHLNRFVDQAKARLDQGEYWWELRPCSYWSIFNDYKISYPELSKFPRFALLAPGLVGNKTTFNLPFADYYLLGILNSRVTWFMIQALCQPLGERAGLLRYMLSSQFMERLPIASADPAAHQALANLAQQLTVLAQQRYTLQDEMQTRLETDLGHGRARLNSALSTWWELSFAQFRTEIKTHFKRDIPVKERQEWQSYLTEQKALHHSLTSQIITLETELNSLVYQIYGLSPEEIAQIEIATKYPYGAV